MSGQRHARPHFTPGKDPVQEAGWAPGPVWTGAENLAPTRIRSPDRPARSQYRDGKFRFIVVFQGKSTKCVQPTPLTSARLPEIFKQLRNSTFTVLFKSSLIQNDCLVKELHLGQRISPRSRLKIGQDLITRAP